MLEVAGEAQIQPMLELVGLEAVALGLYQPIMQLLEQQILEAEVEALGTTPTHPMWYLVQAVPALSF